MNGIRYSLTKWAGMIRLEAGWRGPTCVYKVMPNVPTRLAAHSEADNRVYEVRPKAQQKTSLARVHVFVYGTVKCREMARRTPIAQAEAGTLHEPLVACVEACMGEQAGTGEGTVYSKVH